MTKGERRMKKWFIRLAAITTGLCVLSLPVHAENYPTEKKDWIVWFNAAGNKLESNFTTADIQESIQGMQPGDTADFEINLENRFKTAADWYMQNDVIKKFEDTETARGGAYTYRLTYVTAGGAQNVLYESKTIGGEGSGEDTGGIGLDEATNALDEEEFLFLERIPSQQKAKMLLHIEMDGETQINGYQDTEAAVQITFAVEVPEVKPDKPDEVKPREEHRKRIIYVPNTSDNFVALPYMICGVVSVILFVICAVLLRRTKDEK